MPEYDFSGKVAFVTGAAQGQGRSHALRFAESGADVVAMDLGNDEEVTAYDLGTTDELQSVVEEVEALGQEAIAVRGDVSVEADVENAVGEAVEAFGRIDTLINNAGIITFAELAEMDEWTWDTMIDVNLKGVWLCSKHVSNHMISRGIEGSIVNTSSTLGKLGLPKMGHYAAAKHGVMGLTKSLALELAEYDINVNAICPTGVRTPMGDGIASTLDEESLERAGALAGMENVFDSDAKLEPEDVSDACLWLSSDASRFVTGTAIDVDAGYSAK